MAGFVVICEAVGILGALSTSVSSDWYLNLEKPFFQPPGWLFGPVWTTLYALMGIAAFLVFERSEDDDARPALKLFGLQLILNGLWTPTFFALHKPGLAMIVIGALWLALLLTMQRFWKVRPLAGWLLVPYQLWVTFAAVLNGAIVWLN